MAWNCFLYFPCRLQFQCDIFVGYQVQFQALLFLFRSIFRSTFTGVSLALMSMAFGLGDLGDDSFTELVDLFISQPCPVRFEPHSREPTGVCHEQNLLHREVHMVVICKLSSRQELVPVVLFVARKDTDELLKLLVDAFSLAVGLWVVSGGGRRIYTDEAPQLLGEVHNKLWATVGNILPGSSVVPPDMLLVELGSSDSSETSVALNEVSPLTEDINCDHDHIKPVCIWELYNKVHRDRVHVPALLQDLSQVKLTVGQPTEHLCLVAHIASSDILAHVSGQLEPPVVLEISSNVL
jgi:hypothetical protein